MQTRRQPTAEEITSFLRVHNADFSEVYETPNNILVISVNWGDWKHSHMWLDALMLRLGFKKIKEKVVEEDGSDCYSADHYYCFVINNEKKTTNTMKLISNCKVLRPADFPDCTGGGITARFSCVDVLVDVPFKPIEHNGTTYYDRPDEEKIRQYCREKKLDEKRVLILCDKFNNPIYTPFLKPLDAVWGVKNGETLVGPCAGGNYVCVENNEPGAWRENIYRVHDRYDTEEIWDALSR